MALLAIWAALIAAWGFRRRRPRPGVREIERWAGYR
jgi:hypothetical protein